MIVRAAGPADADALAAIYGHHVLHGTGTFEERPPGAAEMEARRLAVIGQGLPYMVAEEAGRVLGFAYASRFHGRAAYRFTVEDSVYVAPDALGRGVGRALLEPVIAACEALGAHQLVAVIGDSGNAASIGLHRTLGFVHCGVGRGFGYKAGRWLDVVWMQKALNGGDALIPLGSGLDLGPG
jgi:phosphinothricin acetyltransferase